MARCRLPQTNSDEFTELTMRELLYWSRQLKVTPSILLHMPVPELQQRFQCVRAEEERAEKRREQFDRWSKLTELKWFLRDEEEKVRSQGGGGGNSSVWQILSKAAEDIEDVLGLNQYRDSYKRLRRRSDAGGVNNRNSRNTPKFFFASDDSVAARHFDEKQNCIRHNDTSSIYSAPCSTHVERTSFPPTTNFDLNYHPTQYFDVANSLNETPRDSSATLLDHRHVHSLPFMRKIPPLKQFAKNSDTLNMPSDSDATYRNYRDYHMELDGEFVRREDAQNIVIRNNQRRRVVDAAEHTLKFPAQYSMNMINNCTSTQTSTVQMYNNSSPMRSSQQQTTPAHILYRYPKNFGAPPKHQTKRSSPERVQGGSTLFLADRKRAESFANVKTNSKFSKSPKLDPIESTNNLNVVDERSCYFSFEPCYTVPLASSTVSKKTAVKGSFSQMLIQKHTYPQSSKSQGRATNKENINREALFASCGAESAIKVEPLAKSTSCSSTAEYIFLPMADMKESVESFSTCPDHSAEDPIDVPKYDRCSGGGNRSSTIPLKPIKNTPDCEHLLPPTKFSYLHPNSILRGVKPLPSSSLQATEGCESSRNNESATTSNNGGKQKSVRLQSIAKFTYLPPRNGANGPRLPTSFADKTEESDQSVVKRLIRKYEYED